MSVVEEHFGEVESLDANGVVTTLGSRILFADMQLADMRRVAKQLKIGSGVWRAGARKSEYLSAFAAHARGEVYDFSIKQPEPPTVVAVPATPPRAPGEPLRHKSFEVLMRVVKANVPVYLAGPAGSGKSTAAYKVAEALGIPFESKSVGLQSSEVSLLGYQDANGQLVKTPLRKTFEEGGVFLLDEVDAGSPHVLVVLNQLLANGLCSFPDMTVRAHETFRMIAGANTFGTGASREYVGRQQLDGATLDRFAFIEWSYDHAMERTFIGLEPGVQEASEYRINPNADREDATARAEKWDKRVMQLREKIAEQHVRHIIGTRALIYGRRLLDAGIAWESVELMVLKKGLADDVWQRISA